MRVGIPKSLMYFKYHPFAETLFYELGAELVLSPDTNKQLLDQGVKYCVDEACLPVKLFHGHAAYLRDKCDVMLVPRIMQLRKREFICPKFCGLPEMVINSIPDLPPIMGEPIYAYSDKVLFKWVNQAAQQITRSPSKIEKAFQRALAAQKQSGLAKTDKSYPINVALAGHPYNVNDPFVNMNLTKKLNRLGIGVVTEDTVDDQSIDNQVQRLFKKPFWTFARISYGFTTHLAAAGAIDGIIYISSFACGIDSVVVDLIKDAVLDFPFLVLKIDEHTGEAGFDTRVEAFVDMLERRCG